MRNLEDSAVVQETAIAKDFEKVLLDLRGVYRRCTTLAASLGLTAAASYTYFGLLLDDKLPKPISPPPPPSSLEETAAFVTGALGTITAAAAGFFAHEAYKAAMGIKSTLELWYANQNYPELKIEASKAN
ncbi:hypothetical protein HYV83_03605 [Candidatus Woesearchaeota archaeon]|nr:hypothetical protein [Candidatus Woesearchaeota archaeon]